LKYKRKIGHVKRGIESVSNIYTWFNIYTLKNGNTDRFLTQLVHTTAADIFTMRL